ncbi:uncharacterized protein LOC106645145 [Copidosoma floridanum]|uniref:uncharacterized protein LOC106645145 n=1 Tax=Copidosoma floridanum TaxID=29053 RepID=UPI0006C9D805|nr:uncharacterized protein LOC106645145 [Copidosoma floridanum]
MAEPDTVTVPYRKTTRFDELNPFIDDQGLIKVGGRLKNSDLSFGEKHPMVLPTNHHVTDLIIRKVHHKTYHAGIQTTLHTILNKFWIINGKDQVRRIVRRCVDCIRERPRFLHGQMADLPSCRVNETPAFFHVGIDYFGPFFTKEKKERNRNRVKTYGCIFVSMATKAVHLEIVSDLTTAGFLGAFSRFMSRRGTLAHVYSDNGTNYVGANSHLRELYALLNSEKHREMVHAFKADREIVWHFNPPLSPHFGRLQEVAVKSFKHHFKRVLKDQLLTYEQITTLVSEIEAILNSRPLCSLSADPNDPLTISAGHILIGRPFTVLPDHDLTLIPDNRLTTWRFITKARQSFWQRWHKEYLSELQKRQKWQGSNGKIEIGSVVILMDPNLPCSRWPLGVVIETFPGNDDVARVVSVKTANGIFKRNITRLCPLPKE